ncbi:MAG: hypothetical protein J4G05_09160 [Chlorobi bacterium]|nr:hypothetical protein [Chlorobiota bacterium]
MKIHRVVVALFVSDSQPTNASSSDILIGVASWNASKYVGIHTIGLGDDQDENLLRSPAEQNGGTSVRK